MLQDKICSLSNWIFDYKAYSCDSLTTRTSLHSYFNYTNNWDIKKNHFICIKICMHAILLFQLL